MLTFIGLPSSKLTRFNGANRVSELILHSTLKAAQADEVGQEAVTNEYTRGRRLGVVIPNWNGLSHLIPCLESVYGCRPSPDVTVVVDNGSTDGSPEAVARHFPEAVLIRNTENLGFAKATNLGAHAAVDQGCELVLMLNNDTLVAPDLIRLLREAADAPGVEIVNPLITDMQGGIWFGGATYNRWTGAVRHRQSPVDSEAGLIPIASATGCAMLIRAWAVRELGPFDERYFAYYEDSDLSATIRRRGGKIVLQPTAVVRHLISSDARKNAPKGFAYYIFTRNRLLFSRRHLSTPWPLFLVRFTIGYMAPRVLVLLLTGKGEELEAFVRGYLDFFRGRFGAPRLS